MESNLRLSHAGWENYYAAHTDERAWGGVPDAFLLEHLDKLLQANASCVLDVASGDGRNSWPFLERDITVVAADLSPTALATMAQRCFQARVRMPVLLAGDFLASQLVEGQFDCALCFNSIPHFEEPALVIARMAALLRDGGRMVFNAFTPGDVAFGQGEKIGDNRYYYQQTLFTFMSESDVQDILPNTVKVVKAETRRWDEPDHGIYRKGWHTHEACFFILEKLPQAQCSAKEDRVK